MGTALNHFLLYSLVAERVKYREGLLMAWTEEERPQRIGNRVPDEI